MTSYNEMQFTILQNSCLTLRAENKQLKQQIYTNTNIINEHKNVIKLLDNKWKQKNFIIANLKNNESIINKIKENILPLEIKGDIVDIIKICVKHTCNNMLYKKFITTIIQLLSTKKYTDNMIYNFKIILNSLETGNINQTDINLLIDNLMITQSNNIISFELNNKSINAVNLDNTMTEEHININTNNKELINTSNNNYLLNNTDSLDQILNNVNQCFINPDNCAPEYKIYFECYGYPLTEDDFNNIDKEQLENIRIELKI